MVGGWCDKQQSSCNCSLLFKEYQASRRYYRDHKLSMNKIMPWPTGLPSVIRSDHGTENSIISYLQPFLRRHGRDEFHDNSFRYGRSVSNLQVQWEVSFSCTATCVCI